jgi:hypothetical protein
MPLSLYKWISMGTPFIQTVWSPWRMPARTVNGTGPSEGNSQYGIPQFHQLTQGQLPSFASTT